jgi:hypothetical protein
MSKRNLMRAALVLAIVGVASAGVAMAQASGPDRTVEANPEVVAAALTFTDGGAANSVERDSENGATWEVEVSTPEGKVVDVRLDQDLGLVVIEGDSETS